MTGIVNEGDPMSEVKVTPDLAAQLERIADHLVFLEKKLDQLLAESKQPRPFQGGFGPRRDYSRPREGYRGPSDRATGGYNRPRPAHPSHTHHPSHSHPPGHRNPRHGR